MKVILLGEIRGKGGEGDVVDVATGYAVNYLFPNKLATQATPGNLKQLELRKHNIAKREAGRIDTADKLLVALEGAVIRIGAKVGEESQLFGSVTSTQVAEALTERFGVGIDRKRIDLHGTIKTAGEHPATVSIYREVKANIVVEVVDEKALAAAAATAETTDATAETTDATASEKTVEGTTVADLLEEVDEALMEAARNLAKAIDTTEAGSDEAIAEAAVEVFQEIEGVLDATIAEAIAQDVEEKLEGAED
jgi:large subunit ribosomal protein L9